MIGLSGHISDRRKYKSIEFLYFSDFSGSQHNGFKALLNE